MRDMLRDYLKLAAGAALGAAEEVRRLAESGARELLERSGVDAEELRGRVPEPIQSLAEEVVAAGRNNSELLIGLLRSEAEKAWSRVGDGMVQVGVVLELLERQVRHLQGGAEDAPGEPEPTAEQTPRADQAFPTPATRPAPRPTPRPAARPTPRPTPRSAPRPVRVVVDEDGTDAAEAAAAAARRRASVPGLRKTAAKQSQSAPAPAPTPESTPGAKLPAAKKAPAAKKTAARKTPSAQPPVQPPAKKVAKKVAKKAVAPQPAAPVPTEAVPGKRAPGAKKTPAARKTAPRKPLADD
jgi:hypothetical protein